VSETIDNPKLYSLHLKQTLHHGLLRLMCWVVI